MGTADVFLEKIRWLGHDAFRIDAEKTIYIDPYEIAGGPEGDLILVTHAHHDHCSPDDVAKIQGDASVIVTEGDAAGKLSGNIRVVKPGDTITEQGVTIEAVPSYNTDKAFHPRENGWLGFVIEVDGVRVYHAGDTDVIPEMKDIRADIALLPVSGTYVMTADQAVEATLMVNPEIAVPMHYGAVAGSAADAEAFKKGLEGKVDVRILPKSK
ncbi:MAG: MBL fold metallo-hydrolase [Thermodesulfobacteriota bacterium]|nr:MBL fold metallo-hydrolase [Thermodesulfobacteriota bacterium]